MKRGKKYIESAQGSQKGQVFSLDDALVRIKEKAYAKGE